MPNVPVGLYDWAGRLVDTTHTDFNGLYEALEPSTDTYNCPVPAGPCPNMYRFVGNDPGQPGALEPRLQPAVPDDRDELPGLARPVHRDRQGAHPGRRDRARPRTPRRVNPTRVRPRATGNVPAAARRGPARTSDRQRRQQRRLVINGHRASGHQGTGTVQARSRPRLATSRVDRTPRSPLTVPAHSAAGAQSLIGSPHGDGPAGYNMLTLQVLGSGTGPATRRPTRGRRGRARARPYSTVQAALEAANADDGSVLAGRRLARTRDAGQPAR